MDLNKYIKKSTGSTTSSGKSSKGSITVESVNGRLRLRFRVNKVSYTITLGVAESPKNWNLAEQKAWELEDDIRSGKFNPDNLNKYKLTTLQIVKSNFVYEPYIKEVWENYLKYKAPSLKASTLDYLQVGLGKFIKACPFQKLNQSLEIREWLLEVTTTSMVKRVLTHLSAAVNWGIKSKLISLMLNPFEGMANELPKHNWEDNPEPNAFTQEEKEAILS